MEIFNDVTHKFMIVLWKGHFYQLLDFEGTALIWPNVVLLQCRYAVKLLCDETVLGEAENYSELSEYLQGYESDYHIGSEEEPEWEQAILNHVPNLFSLGKSQDTVSVLWVYGRT